MSACAESKMSALSFFHLTPLYFPFGSETDTTNARWSASIWHLSGRSLRVGSLPKSESRIGTPDLVVCWIGASRDVLVSKACKWPLSPQETSP